jgi:hypothetical protein
MFLRMGEPQGSVRCYVRALWMMWRWLGWPGSGCEALDGRGSGGVKIWYVLGNEGREALNECVGSLSVMVCVPLPAWCYQGMIWCPMLALTYFRAARCPLARGLGTMIATLLPVRDSRSRDMHALVRRLSGDGRREGFRNSRRSAESAGVAAAGRFSEKVWARQPPQ